MYVKRLYIKKEKEIQDLRLLYYLIREIKTTSQYTVTHILYFKTQRTVIENAKFP